MRRLILLLAALTLLLALTGCDDNAASSNSQFNWQNDPPPLMTVVNQNNQVYAVRVDFHPNGTGVTVRSFANFVLPAGVRPLPGEPSFKPEGGSVPEGLFTRAILRWAADSAWAARQVREGHLQDSDDGVDAPVIQESAFPLRSSSTPRAVPAIGLMPFPRAYPMSPAPPSQPEEGAAGACNAATAPLAYRPSQGTLIGINSCSGRAASIIPAGASLGAADSIPGDKTLYVASNGPAALLAVNTATGAVTEAARLPSDARPYGLAISPTLNQAFISSFVQSQGRLYVVDLETKAVIRTVPVGNYANEVVLSPDGLQVWVSSYFEDAVFIYDALTAEQIGRVNGITNAWGIAFLPDGSRAYVASSADSFGSVKVIDTSTFTIAASVPVGNMPRNVAISPTGRHAFVTNLLSDSISQIDTATNTVVRSIRVGTGAEGLAFVP